MHTTNAGRVVSVGVGCVPFFETSRFTTHMHVINTTYCVYLQYVVENSTRIRNQFPSFKYRETDKPGPTEQVHCTTRIVIGT